MKTIAFDFPAAAALLAVSCVLLAAPARAGDGVDTASLLEELCDLRELSLAPEPDFTCRQFSSYDPKSVSPEQDWFANADRGHYLRVEENAGRTEYVMLDAEGPGAVVRIWSANPQGTLRVYIDGSDEPAVEAEMTAFLNGEAEGFPFPIAHVASRGWNSYFPIPYARHCKLTSDKGDFYYQVNYRTYARSAAVESFDKKTPARLAREAAEACRRMQAPWQGSLLTPGGAAGSTGAVVIETVEIEPGGSKAIRPAMGAGAAAFAVRGLEVKVEAGDVDKALRGIVLKGSFDGNLTIDCPLGDFFGAAPGLCAYQSLPLGVTDDGRLWCRWWMPYRENAEFVLVNHSGAPAAVTAGIETVAAEWTDRTMYFHAKWRMEKKIPTRPMKDWNYITVEGAGTFVGDALYVSNPVRNWWGEGDEKIYVDGETFPSHFGTGTEDYYGYAWCCPELFTNAFHNQPRCDGPGNYGHTAVNRWHVLDRIPFKKSFRFDMEVWHWAEVDVDYAATSCYYAFAGARDNAPHPEADMTNLELSLIPPYKPHKVDGAIEGEGMEVVESTGVTEKQGAGQNYSGEAHLWWREAKAGDRLVLGFESGKAGPHRVIAVMTRAPDYGIHQLAVNGKKAGEPFDLFKSGQWGPTDEIALGVFELKKGQNLLSVTIMGKNEEAIPNFMFGLDYLRIESL